MNTISAECSVRSLLGSLAPGFRDVAALSFFVNLLALAVPVFTLQVYDRVVFHAGINTLYALVIGIAIVILFDFVLRHVRARILQTVALRIDVHLGQRLFETFSALPLAYLEQRPLSLWQALFRDVDVVRNTLSGASALLLCDVPFAVLFIGLTFVIAEPIAWVAVSALPLFLLLAWRSAAAISSLSDHERALALNRDGLLAEMIAGRSTIKALALERALRPLWEERQAAAIEQAMRRGSRSDAYSTLASTLTMTTQVAMTTVGALAILEQKLTIGALIAAGMLSGRMLAPMSQLVGNWRLYSGFRQSLQRLGATLSQPVDRQAGAIEGRRPQGRIVLEELSFSYPGSTRPVIDGVCLEITSPGLTALVWTNGSGKSTLLKLILGLYAPTAGRVLLDGADISQFSRSELAEWIGYLPQECVLFNGTIRDAIACRRPGAEDCEVIAAAEQAGAHAFIIDLADGYGSRVGEGGYRLSSGQRQRLVLARALIGEPPILLLDEPSANLDRQAEAALRTTLIELGRSRTVVVITHSPLLLGACNTAIVLDRGRVAASGPPAKILFQRTQPMVAEAMASDGLTGIGAFSLPADRVERDLDRRPPIPRRT